VGSVKRTSLLTPSGTPQFICYTSFLLSQIDNILRAFDIGSHGQAYVFAANGQLIGTTLSLSNSQRATVNLFQAQTLPLTNLAPILIGYGFADAASVDPSLTDVLPPPVESISVNFRNGGTAYNLRAAQITITELNRILVLW
jgi:hypothetical protein